MKVFFCLDALINAGSEKSTLDLVSKFSDRTKVHVVYFYPMHDLRDAFLNTGVSLHFMDLKSTYSFAKGTARLIRLIKQHRPDVVVSSILRANIMSRVACALTGTKLVGTFISDSYSKERTSTFTLSRKISFTFFKWLDRFTAKVPVQWISNSRSIAESNAKHLGISMSKVKVIYRGRDAEMMKVWTPPVKNEPFIFITVGRLLETKGFQDIILALHKLIEKHSKVQLHIYGEGNYRKNLEFLIEKLGIKNHVLLHGNVPDATQYFSSAHCFIFSSWYEGFSGALVEGMMTGIPIIASDISMNLEAVTDGQTALVHKVKDVQDIHLKMREAMNCYREMISMGKKARETALSRFNSKEIAGVYESFLLSLN